MKLIPLTQGQFAKVDDEDYEWLMQFSWQARWSKRTKSFYASRFTSRTLGDRHLIQMHREIMQTPKGMDCDHIHHDTLDNRKSELRNCTHSQNSMNRKGAVADSKTGVLGVYNKKPGKFQVNIKVDGRNVQIGTFSSIEEAILVRREAEKKYYGEFANSN